MKKTFTLSFVKPHAFLSKNQIVILILQAGYQILSLKVYQFSREEAERFYGIHKDKPFFKEIVDHLIEGPVCMMLLTKSELSHTELIDGYRTFIGATDPRKAEPGTIRELFGKKELGPDNAVHASDSVENAYVEAARCFPDVLIQILAA